MPSVEITNTNSTGVLISDGRYQSAPVTFTAAATLAAGTILARDSVTLKLIPFVKGGVANGNGIPKAVLEFPLTSTAAGDLNSAVLVSGVLRRNKLVINADGTAVNVDGAVIDQLRDYGLLALDSVELSALDNQ